MMHVKTRSGFLTRSLACLGMAGLLLSPAAAQSAADQEVWQICNETSFIVRVATAVERGTVATARGWTRLRPGQCYNGGAPISAVRHVFAESSRAYAGGIREWKGTAEFCSGRDDFSATSDQSCDDQGLTQQLFIPVSDHDPITRLVEPDNYGRRAEVAGLQRLLRENGYTIRRIDGVSGRRTTRTAARFLRDNKLVSNLSLPQQIDALEKAVLAKMGDRGLTVCNTSSDPIWIATGHRRGEAWESRGWWALKIGGCAQPVTDTLKGKDMHVFARQAVTGQAADAPPAPDKHLRSDPEKTAEFCIAEAKFSAHGREDCANNGYEAVKFRILPNDVDGTTLSLTDADFVPANVNGLRR